VHAGGRSFPHRVTIVGKTAPKDTGPPRFHKIASSTLPHPPGALCVCVAGLVGRTTPSPFSALLHMECNILVLSPSQTVTPLSPGRGGARAGAAGVRDVCGPESDVRVSALRLFHNIEG